jgi:hypothetical protein
MVLANNSGESTNLVLSLDLRLKNCVNVIGVGMDLSMRLYM